MKKLLKQLIFVCLIAAFGATWAQGASLRLNSPFYTELKNKFQSSSYITSDPGTNRFHVMLFYMPNSNEYQDSGAKVSKVNAVALYLYHMYVTSAAYNFNAAPGKLTTNYIGVTDGLDHIKSKFDVSEVDDFYNSNKQEIKKVLASFFQNVSLKNLGLQVAYNTRDAKNDAVEKAFLQTLKNSNTFKGVQYLFPKYHKTGKSISAEVKALQQKWMNQALAEIKDKIALYEQNMGVDVVAGKYVTDMHYYYRPAQDECAVCTYYTCRRICQEVDKTKAQFGQVRIYTVEARPKTGGTLLSSERNKKQFTLANGSVAKDWGYHQATLVVYSKKGSRVAVGVIDKFLFKEPVSLDTWAKRFDQPSTRLSIKLFMRNKSVEKNVAKPEGYQGSSARVRGRSYQRL